MSKANRKAITTPVAIELTRRSTLGALVASAALIPPASGIAICTDDPIFMLIEQHHAARTAFSSALTVLNDLEDGALFRRPPRVQLGVTEDVSLTIGEDTFPIPGGRPYYATERDHITAIEDEARRDVLLAEWDRQVAEVANPELDAAKVRANQLSDAENEATIALLTTAPTTLAGATALLRYISEHHDEDYLATDCGEAGNGYGALVSSLIGVLAQQVRQ